MSATKFLLYISQNYSFAILRPLQDAIRKTNREVFWFVQGNAVNLDYFAEDERIIENAADIVKYNPDAVIFPANIAPTFFPGLNVAVFHGFDAGKVDKRGRNDHYKVRNCFDLYCTQGPDTTKEFQRLASIHQTFRVAETGWCALDPLFNMNKVSNKEEKPTVLMCSTFSKKLTCAPHLFEEVKRLSETGRWNWLVQFHPKMDKKIVDMYKSIQGEHLSYIETDNIVPLLNQADVMVCDTSSVLIMFILQGKPVVTFNNASPEDYLIDIDLPSKLEESIEKAFEPPKVLLEKIYKYINDTHPYSDGNSSYRVLEAIDKSIAEKGNLKAKPLDFFRQLKMRRQLKYWKI
ncbi:CDP-glycerol glycerophosphotransferase family protein [Cognaticolwellia mytili]|uniref:CDP-glycerol glycerophosphotransferase family protein n=1 Tax=Cognaticolwellia mytili TaxID=1888913 RepID=UPI000A16F7C2|nr:CDP-glycerol glycerophosphotransferase family protein [Cognaticolwellia mytili]